MEKYESMLKFKGYNVNNVAFIRNNEFKPTKKVTEIDLEIIPRIIVSEQDMEVNLQTNIFTDAKKNSYPFEMQINITGEFSVDGETPDKFKTHAIAILYPYIRAIVSTYTSIANITPLILPAINVNKLIEDQEKD